MLKVSGPMQLLSKLSGTRYLLAKPLRHGSKAIFLKDVVKPYKNVNRASANSWKAKKAESLVPNVWSGDGMWSFNPKVVPPKLVKDNVAFLVKVKVRHKDA